jgi:predicted phosphodiesterase
MALYGILGDIHGNREALEAALAVLDASGAERLLCIGDIVGYNADPDACVEALRSREALAIAGNHDLAAIGRLGLERCSNASAYALRRTQRSMSSATVRYLESLPARLLIEDRILLVHGGLRDSEQRMACARQVRQNASRLAAALPAVRLCLFGHTHAQRVYEFDGGEVAERGIGSPARLREDCVSFVNPGSVDAARKRDHERFAECALLDSNDWTIEFLRARYDHAAAEAKAIAGGYRIGWWSDRIYSARRGVSRLGARLALTWRGLAAG